MDQAQMHLFEPTLEQLIEELINEPIEKFVIYKSFLLEEGKKFYHMKVLSPKKIYDLSISESYEHQSYINAVYERKKVSKRLIKRIFVTGKFSW